MSYALNEEMLVGGYGALDHAAMMWMKDAIDAITLYADNVLVTCPRGTRFEGAPAADSEWCGCHHQPFPLGIPRPLPAEGFAGRLCCRTI